MTKRKITEKNRQASLPLMEAVAMHTGIRNKIEKDFTKTEATRIIRRLNESKKKTQNDV